MIEFNLLTSNTPACAIQVGPSGSNRVDFLFFLLMKHMKAQKQIKMAMASLRSTTKS